MMDNGKEIVVKDMEFKCGQMVQDIKEIGKIIKLMVKENLFMLMEIFIKVNGKMIKLMDLVVINIPMELHMKDIGKMIINKEKEHKNGLMVVDMKGSIKEEKRMGKDIIFGATKVFIKEIG
jgi:hypothetical protein